MAKNRFLKSVFAFLLLATICNSAFSQIVTIGAAITTTSDFPTNTSKNFSITQQIYTTSEVGASGTICGISLYRTSNENLTRTLNIYLGHTSKTIFNNTTDWEPASSLTQVFSGSVIFTSDDWTYINFDIPFIYSGLQNIVIGIDDNTQVIDSVVANTFKYTTASNKTIYFNSNSINSTFTAPSAGTISGERNNIKIHKCLPTPMSNSLITNCDMIYSDANGLNQYAPNQNYTQTIVSGSINDHFMYHFMDFSLGIGDTLWIYNGGSINASLIGIFTWNNTPFDFTASADSLTFRFKSDAIDESTGWLAYIYCRPCDPISFGSGSPCQPNINNSTGYAASPFCTDVNPFGVTFPSATTGNGNVYLSTPVGCLSEVPRPAWYFMQINNPGNMLISISLTSSNGYSTDVDFACWGPFYADNQADFMQRWCCGEYELYKSSGVTHQPINGNHTNNMGGYPINNLIDCSFAYGSPEWCFIPNAQTGQFYILLLTNYRGYPGTITFNTVPLYTTATTDCSLLASVSNNGPICEGGTIQLTCHNPQPGATYSWTGPNGFISSLQNPTINNISSSNSGTYSLVITNNNLTSTPATTIVSVFPHPTVQLTVPQTNICLGDSITLSATGASSYSWNNGLGTGNTKTVTPLTTTTYIVTGTQSGCIDTSSYTINVRPIPNTIINPLLSSYCPNIGSVNVQTTTTSGSPAYTYTWSGLGVSSSTSSSNIVQIDSTNCNQNYNIMVQVSDQYGCYGRDTVSFVVIDTTDPVFITLPFPIQYALGTYPNFTVPDFSNLVLANSSDQCWGNSQLTVTQNIVSGSSIDTNTYALVTVTDPCGNSVSTYIRLIIPFHISITDTVNVRCYGGQNGSATVTATGGISPYSYSWNSFPAQSGSQATYLISGNYQVTVTDSLGISNIAYVTIQQPTIMNSNTSGVNPLCYGDSTGSVSVTITGGIQPYQYLWNTGGTEAQITQLPIGTYQVTITDANACTQMNNAEIIQPDEIVSSSVSTPKRCNYNNGAVHIQVFGGVAPYSYHWNTVNASLSFIYSLDSGIYTCTITDDNGCIHILTDTVVSISPLDITAAHSNFETCNMHNGSIELTIEDGTLPYIYHWTKGTLEGTSLNNLESGYYSILVTDHTGCIDTTSIFVDHFQIEASIANQMPSICERNNGSFSLEIESNNDTYTIDWGNITDHTNLNANNLSPGIYPIYVEEEGCFDTLNVEITEIPKPIACIENEMEDGILINQPILLLNCSSFASHYQWTFGDGISELNEHPSHFYTSSGMYQVKLFAFNDYDCIDSATTTILVNDVSLVYIPNSFTPNNDGVNDIFIPVCSYIGENGYSFKIFNRWGELIFYSTDSQMGWDGTYKGQPVPSQSYSYILIYENGFGQKFRKLGAIQLIR